MATKYEQQLVSQYGAPMENYINSERGNSSGPLRGVNVDPQDVNRIVAGFKSSPYAVNNVVGAVTNPTPTYNYSDPYGARTAIEQRLGYNDATAAEQTAQKNLLGFQDTTRAQINKLRANRNLSTGLEAGFQAQRTREATQQEQVLSNELKLAQQKRLALENKVSQEYNIYQQERANRENLLLKAIEAGAKNVNIGMNTEQLANAYTDAQNKAKEQATKDAEKQSLKEMYYKLTGEWPKPMSRSRLRSKIKSAAKKAHLKQDEIDNLNKQIKEAQLAKATSVSGSSGSGFQDEVVVDTSTGKVFNTGNKVKVGTPTKFVNLQAKDNSSNSTDFPANAFSNSDNSGGFLSGVGSNIKNFWNNLWH